MNWIETVKDIILATGLATAVLFALSSLLGKIWANRIMQKEIHELNKNLELFKLKLNSEVALNLEEYKKELEIKFNDKSQRRKVYEELSSLIEEILLLEPNIDCALKINKIFGLLAIYAPDDVYLNVKNAIPCDKYVDVTELRPALYCALRKDIFQNDTSIVQKDIAVHFSKFNSAKKN